MKFQKQTGMTFSETKSIVGLTNVKIKSSSFRCSELFNLAEKAALMENGILTIVVDDTLNFSEIQTLSNKGSRFVALDFTGR